MYVCIYICMYIFRQDQPNFEKKACKYLGLSISHICNTEAEVYTAIIKIWGDSRVAYRMIFKMFFYLKKLFLILMYKNDL
jgi:hypothetical protein